MKDLKSGQKVKLEFKTNLGEPKQIICDIAEAYKDRLKLKVSEEILNCAKYLLEGESVSASIYTSSGIEVMESIILNSPLEESFEIEYNENFKKIQRRNYVRVDAKVKVILQNSNELVVGTTVDVGGGGIRFEATKPPLPIIDNFYNAKIMLSEDEPSIQASGTVVRKNHFVPDEFLLIFEKISEQERNRVIKKCIQIQSSAIKEQANM